MHWYLHTFQIVEQNFDSAKIFNSNFFDFVELYNHNS